MSRHAVIPSRRSLKTSRPTTLMRKLGRAREFSLEDVRRCMYSHPHEVSAKECRHIFTHARLRKLTKNPLRTLRSHTAEMNVCLRYGNRDAHYIEGIKKFFALHDHPSGMKHLRLSATKRFAKARYLYAILKLLAGDHEEGMSLLDCFRWEHNTYWVDKIWKRVKRSLRDVPIINRRSYGVNMLLIMPPRACSLKGIDERCSKCFYYKEMEKFLQLINRG